MKLWDSLTIIYESVQPVMRTLRAAKVRTGIVTTKLNYRIRSILASNHLEGLFDVIVGADNVERTSQPQALLLALRQLGVSPASAVYVGDHIIDAQAASNAGIPFIAALTGKHLRHAFEAYPHRAIVQSVSDVPAVLCLR